MAAVQLDEVEGFGLLVDRVIDDAVHRLGRRGYRRPEQRRQLFTDGCCRQQRRSGGRVDTEIGEADARAVEDFVAVHPPPVGDRHLGTNLRRARARRR